MCSANCTSEHPCRHQHTTLHHSILIATSLHTNTILNTHHTLQGEGRSKKEAEAAAAELALQFLSQQPSFTHTKPCDPQLWTTIAKTCAHEVSNGTRSPHACQACLVITN